VSRGGGTLKMDRSGDGPLGPVLGDHEVMVANDHAAHQVCNALLQEAIMQIRGTAKSPATRWAPHRRY
jgi:hypothetical protein